MDFRLYTRVLWRFRLLVAAGTLVALLLAGLSVFKLENGGLAYRQSELWSHTTRLGVTQSGFPWGRLLAENAGERPRSADIPITDPNRLNTLAVLYAELATSDAVRGLLLADGPLGGKITATPVVVGENRVMLPLVDVTAVATSPGRARRLAVRAATALQTYIAEEQRANGVPRADRVVVEAVTTSKPPRIFQPRSTTLPMVILLAVLFATVATAFLLENIRPRPRDEAEPAEPTPRVDVRRTA